MPPEFARSALVPFALPRFQNSTVDAPNGLLHAVWPIKEWQNFITWDWIYAPFFLINFLNLHFNNAYFKFFRRRRDLNSAHLFASFLFSIPVQTHMFFIVHSTKHISALITNNPLHLGERHLQTLITRSSAGNFFGKEFGNLIWIFWRSNLSNFLPPSPMMLLDGPNTIGDESNKEANIGFSICRYNLIKSYYLACIKFWRRRITYGEEKTWWNWKLNLPKGI
jgi:hypothetical protein